MKNQIAQALDPTQDYSPIIYADFPHPVSVSEQFIKMQFSLVSIVLMAEVAVILIFLIFFRNKLARPTLFYTSLILSFIGFLMSFFSSRRFILPRDLDTPIYLLLLTFTISIIGYGVGYARWLLYTKTSPEIERPSHRYLGFLIIGFAAVFILGMQVTTMVY